LAIDHNGNNLIAGIKETVAEKGKGINNNDENHLLHGDWLVVTRRKKSINQNALNVQKNVTQKHNRYNVLSFLVNQSKVDPTNNKLPHWPKSTDYTRGSNSSLPKRCGQHDTHVRINKSLLRQP